MKIKVAHPFDPATPPLKIHPTGILTRVQDDPQTTTYTAVLFVTAKDHLPPK